MVNRTWMSRIGLIAVCAGLFVSSLLYADEGVIKKSRLGPATATSQVTLAAISGERNCVSNVDVISDAGYTVRILDGGTTVYALTLAANAGMIRSWNSDDAICGTSNTAMVIKISAGTYQINYTGFTY